MAEDELLSLAQVADELQRSRMTVIRHIRAGDLPAEKVGDRFYVVRRADLDHFKANRRPPGRPPKVSS